jgi:hypothetical protein
MPVARSLLCRAAVTCGVLLVYTVSCFFATTPFLTRLSCSSLRSSADIRLLTHLPYLFFPIPIFIISSSDKHLRAVKSPTRCLSKAFEELNKVKQVGHWLTSPLKEGCPGLPSIFVFTMLEYHRLAGRKTQLSVEQPFRRRIVPLG